MQRRMRADMCPCDWILPCAISTHTAVRTRDRGQTGLQAAASHRFFRAPPDCQMSHAPSLRLGALCRHLGISAAVCTGGTGDAAAATAATTTATTTLPADAAATTTTTTTGDSGGGSDAALGGVTFEDDGKIAVLTLAAPFMNPDALEFFERKVGEVKRNRAVRCLIVQGTGRSFCAGANFKSATGAQMGAGDVPKPERSFAIYRPFLSLLGVDVPVIAAMNGHAIGGGLGLAIVCDIRVAHASSKYGANFTRLGLHPGMATTYILPRLVGLPRALELLLTGRIITGAEAAVAGLVNHACATPELVFEKALEIAREVATCAPIAVRWTKQMILQQTNFNPTPAAWLEAHLQSRTLETADAEEGIAAMLQKRKPEHKGR